MPARRHSVPGRGDRRDPELVAPADRDRALVPPDHIALGNRIADLAAAPLRPVQPRWDFDRARDGWERWHAQTAPFDASAERFSTRTHDAAAETPLVTICLVHHERPRLVRMAIESVLAQDYPAIEAVLVDDGSESAEALAALEEIQAEFGARGWHVVRQENRYLGAARNRAAAAAQGEWLLFLDDDNLLFPDAVSRLVRAAHFAQADCVTAASIRFFGDGDPRTDSGSHGTPIRFLGAARAWSHVTNVVGDAGALVRREAFTAVGGYTEKYRVGLDDLCFYNGMIRAGLRIESLPEPVYYYRIGTTSMKSRNRSVEAARFRAVTPYLEGLPDEERAFAACAAAHISKLAATAVDPSYRQGCVMALARRPSRFGIDDLEVSILIDPEWFDEACQRDGRPMVELRCNGRLLGQAPAQDLHTAVRIAAGSRLRAIAGALYSLHDAANGETLAVLATPAFLQARRVVGAVENHPQAEVRGWLLDEAVPRRRRRAAVYVDGGLRAVIRAEEQRGDIARWKKTDGRHGFRWRPSDVADVAEGTRIEVLDVETGRALRGSPVHIERGTIVAATEPVTTGPGATNVP